jgi:hypothetical protein
MMLAGVPVHAEAVAESPRRLVRPSSPDPGRLRVSCHDRNVRDFARASANGPPFWRSPNPKNWPNPPVLACALRGRQRGYPRSMMLAGVPVQADAVAELAIAVRAKPRRRVEIVASTGHLERRQPRQARSCRRSRSSRARTVGSAVGSIGRRWPRPPREGHLFPNSDGTSLRSRRAAQPRFRWLCCCPPLSGVEGCSSLR